MKKLGILIFTIFLMFTNNSLSAQAVTSFAPDKFRFALSEEKKPQLLDVRTDKEFKEDHIKGAVNIDINSIDFQQQVIRKFDKDKIVFVYCRSGKRSLRAALMLEKMDYKVIYNLEGGILAWKAANYETKKKHDLGDL